MSSKPPRASAALMAERVEKLRQMVESHPDGMSASKIRDALKLSGSAAKHAIQVARDAGHIACAGPHSTRSRWVTPDRQQAVSAKLHDEAAAALAMRRQCKAEQERRARQEAAEQAEREADLVVDAVVHIRRPANEAPPLAKTAPASVFELGAFV